MPQQLTFAQAEYAAKKKVTRRELFLQEMEQALPWSALHALIKPHYYLEEGRGAGHPPIGLDRMLRMYLLQQYYNLADEALEDAIYDSKAFGSFLALDLGRESVPDATTLLGFRHLLETEGLQAQIFETINAVLREHGLIAYSDESGHSIRRKATTRSDRIRPPSPKESGRGFR